MTKFIIRRVMYMFVIIFAAMSFTFVLSFLIPKDPARSVAGPMATELELANVRQSLGLNDPFYLQYFHYLQRALHGDLGRSWVMHRPVWEAVFAHLGPSLQLALAAAIVELVLGATVGMISTVWRYKWPDRVSMVISLILLSLPGFWFALVLLYLFGYVWPILPLGGFGGLDHLVLPACAVGVPYSAWYARMLRSNMLEVINEDYMRTAHAKGLSARLVFLRHGLRNAIIPIITMWGMDLGSFLAGLALVETVFGWPGVGWQAVEAARNLDVPLVMGSVLLISILVAVSNLAVDVSYHWLDPRVTYS
jgi:peptide/nickel transport system permease protein